MNRPAGACALTIEPLSVVPASAGSPAIPRAAPCGMAPRAYFPDDRAFPEPEAFWIGGAQRAIVIQPDGHPAWQPCSSAMPVDNHIRFESAGWRDEMSLGAGEERRVQIPIDPQRGQRS
jgi:hypothetical protein